MVSSERILGSSKFVQSLLLEVDEREKETLKSSEKFLDLKSLAMQISKGEGIKESDLRSGSKKKVSTSAVVRAASSKELSEVESYL